MEVQHGKVRITLQPNKRMASIAVMLCIPFKLCRHCLTALKSGAQALPAPLCEGGEEAALAYAVFELVRAKLMGDPLDVYRTRVTQLTCAEQNGQFIIRWNTSGTLSSLRKTCGLVAKSLVPTKLYSKYAINIKNLGGKQARSIFNYVAKRFVSALDKGIDIIALGKLSLETDKLKQVAEFTSGKIPDQVIPSGDEEAPPKREHIASGFPLIRMRYGLASVVVADYISSKLGVDTQISSEGVEVHMGSIEGKMAILKRGIDDFVRTRYEKLGDDLAPMLTYLAATKYDADCFLVCKIIKEKPTSAALLSVLRAHF